MVKIRLSFTVRNSAVANLLFFHSKIIQTFSMEKSSHAYLGIYQLSRLCCRVLTKLNLKLIKNTVKYLNVNSLLNLIFT